MDTDLSAPVSAATLASRAGHAHGCREDARASQVMDGYLYCAGCKRMIRLSPPVEEGRTL